MFGRVPDPLTVIGSRKTLAVKSYYRRYINKVDLPQSLWSIAVGDFVRADLVRKLKPEQIVCFDLAIHVNRLPVEENERGLAVLVSPLRRTNRRTSSAFQRQLVCPSKGHRDSASLPFVESSNDPDVIFCPTHDNSAGWEIRLAESCGWRGWSSESVESGLVYPGVEEITEEAPTVGIIVTVFNKPSRFVPCIGSVIERTKYPLSKIKLIIVNDGSDKYSATRLSELADAARESGIETELINQPNCGYLLSANKGADRAVRLGCDSMVFLNSDVLVTKGWLSGMVRCQIRTGADLINPLSNQQAGISVPLATEKSWGFPRLNGRVGYIRAAELCSVLPPKYPDAVTSVGQCLLVTARAWASYGPFNQDVYGSGYGEECELWAQVLSGGGLAKVADDVYVYHESHGTHEYAKEREEAGAKTFINRWRKLYNNQAVKIRVWPEKYRDLRTLAFVAAPSKPTVRFIAYNIGPYGGVACVLKIVDGLNERGFNASVEYCLEQDHHFKFKTGPNKHHDATSLRRLSMDSHSKDGIIVATHWFTGDILQSMMKRDPSFIPLAFWQDREDLFVEPDGRLSVKPAWVKSYTAIQNRIVNARWVGDSAIDDLGISSFTHIPVGVDTELFYPAKRVEGGPVKILAMYRPSTPRRGARRIHEVFSHIRTNHPGRVVLETFGEDTSIGDFNYGSISQDEVARRMREADIVLEPSDFQGFGLPGLEAMASGAALCSTDNKGIHEYGISESNCLISTTDEEYIENVDRLILDEQLRARLRQAGRDTAVRFDWEKIVDIWATVLNELLEKR